MDWIIRQLFGAHAVESLLDKLRAEIAIYILANPQLSRDAVLQWAMTQAGRILSQVLVHFPGWAVSVLIPFLEAQIAKLVEDAYDGIIKAVQSERIAVPAG